MVEAATARQRDRDHGAPAVGQEPAHGGSGGRVLARLDLRPPQPEGPSQQADGDRPGSAPLDGHAVDARGTADVSRRAEPDADPNRGGPRVRWLGGLGRRVSQALANGLGRRSHRRDRGGSSDLHADGGGDGAQGGDGRAPRWLAPVVTRAEHRRDLDLREEADQHDRDLRAGRAGGLQVSGAEGGKRLCAGSSNPQAREWSTPLGARRNAP